MIASFLQDLHDPKYVHVLINPTPVYGLVMGIIGLIIALLQRSRPAQVATLALIFLAALSAWPTAHYGEEGYDIALSLADDQGGAWLKAHMHRADQLVWFFYVVAGVAAAAIIVPIKWPKLRVGLTSLTLVLAFFALGMGGYIAYAGGRVMHHEFRHQPAPPVPAEETD
jgi:disulfide bond formation protein DsbB